MRIFVMNIEAFSSSRGIKAGNWIAKKFGSRGLIAIDESTTIKNPKAKRTKSLILIIFSLTAFYVYQYVIGVLILLLAIHTIMND